MEISVSRLEGWISQAIQLALILIFVVTIAQMFGINIPFVPTMGPLNLLYVCAAWALINGRIKLG